MLCRQLTIAAALALALALACTKKNPRYCASDRDCPTGRCDLAAKECRAADGGVDAADARDAEAGDAHDAGDVPFRCKGGSDCADAGPDGSAAVCELEAGACVECVKDDDCKADAAPICNLTTHSCERCTTDLQCATKLGGNPGICMSHQDGRCAADAETIYVKNGAGCSMTAGSGGTKDVPYCLSQDGINAVTAQQRLVVMRGPDALSYWAASLSGPQVSIIGQGGATIAPGAFIGVHLTGGNAYLRGLRIANGSSTGVVVDGGAEIHVDGCIIESNGLGGIKVDGASFDVTNTVIAKNMSTSTAGCGGWAGACFNNVVGTPRFLNNTVVANVGTGLACSSAATPIAGSIVYGNTPDNSVCTLTTCCSSSANPMLTADYRLTAASTACIDQLDPALSTADDIDGQLRPRGSKSDCGADEY